MNRAQKRFGGPLELVEKKISTSLDPMVREFISQAPFVVLATSGEGGRCDASPKGGRPGFVKVIDESRIVLPDIAGNNLFKSYGNLETNPHVGLLFLEPGSDWTVRVNGSVSVLDKNDEFLDGVAPEVFAPDENTRMLQALLVRVEEAYAHCPRAFTFSELWDTERIAQARASNRSRYWLDRWKEVMRERDVEGLP
jgi:predicted pyridoxine 5'-phosphate oxidase superfamily flavin-nucleotide-binding protein